MWFSCIRTLWNIFSVRIVNWYLFDRFFFLMIKKCYVHLNSITSMSNYLIKNNKQYVIDVFETKAKNKGIDKTEILFLEYAIYYDDMSSGK